MGLIASAHSHGYYDGDHEEEDEGLETYWIVLIVVIVIVEVIIAVWAACSRWYGIRSFLWGHFTVRNEVAKVMFLHVSVSYSVHRGVSMHIVKGEVEGSGQGGSLGPHPGGKLRSLATGVSRPTPRGEVEGSGLGVCPGGGCLPGDVCPGECLPRRGCLLWMVRVLLECILVFLKYFFGKLGRYQSFS